MNNSISIVGTGYVGLVTGACLSEFGLNVTCMDTDNLKIANLKNNIIPIFEPGLEDLVKKNVTAGRLKFTSDFLEAVNGSQTILIAVGTPPCEDGSADLTHVLSVAESIAERMDSYKVIVDKSTVPVGTGQMVKQKINAVLKKRGVEIPFDVVSNPEFLREGAAVQDFMHPDRIIIGAESDRAIEAMKNVYRVLYLNNNPFLFTNLETAELIKYAANAFLAVKISFINEISDICEKVGADVQQVSKGMGMDGRIGKYFLHAGPGYGGSCFPKDTKALVKIAEVVDSEMGIVKSAMAANARQKMRMAEKIDKALDGLDGKTVGVLGLAFKPETDDMREAPSETIITELIKRGAIIRAFDPVAMDNAKKSEFGSLPIYYAKDEYDAADGVDAIVIITEWNQFRSLDLNRIKNAMIGNVFVDLRNIYTKDMMDQYGFNYHSVGR